MKKTGHFFKNNAIDQQSVHANFENNKDVIVQLMGDFNIKNLEYFIPLSHYEVNNNSVEASKLGFANLNLIVSGDMALSEFNAFSQGVLNYFPKTDMEFFTYKTLNQMLVEKAKQLSLSDETILHILDRVIDSIKPGLMNNTNDPNQSYKGF